MTVEHIARLRGTLNTAAPITDIRHRTPRRKLSEMTVAPLIGVAAGMALAVAALTIGHVAVTGIAAIADPQVSSW